MRWPRRPVEQIPHRQFQPPHCPWPDCTQHLADHDFPYKRFGFYARLCDARRVQRFCCHACHRTFSQQSFATSYYAKLPRIAPRIAAGLNAGSAHRQIARSLGCAPSSVTRRAARLGRHALLLQARALEHHPGLREPVAADHFESFVECQLDALGLATVVGHKSWFLYAVDPAPHRRGGRLTPAQRRKRQRRIRPAPPPRSVRQSFRRVLDLLVALLPPAARLELLTDNHPAYSPALVAHPAAGRIDHRAYPNPPRGPKGSPRSARARERDRALFPVDQLHLLWRHSAAHHRRETLAFPRRINAAVERAHLLAVWRNFVKGRSERKPDRETPAMRLGLADEPWSWQRVLAQRLFPRRVELPAPWRKVYDRDWDEDRPGYRYTRHRCRHAV